MKRVRITIDPTDIPMVPTFHRLTGDDTIDQAHVVNWNLSESPTVFLYHVRGEYDGLVADLEEADYAVDYEILPQGDRECYCFFAGEVTPGSRELLEGFSRRNVLAIPPICLNRNGTITVTLIGTETGVQEAVGAVDDRVAVTIDAVGGEQVATDSVAGALSPRQREAIEAALELGYYDLPRDVVLEDVAGELGCTMETAAEHLRKAEATVITSLFDRTTT